MRIRPVAVMVLTVAVGGLAAWMMARRSADRQTEPPEPRLEATRLQPAPDGGSEVECEPFARVEFVYLVRNRGREPISGLTVALGCQCEQSEEPPDKITPGGAARVGFRLRAPDFGGLQRRVDLVTQEPRRVVLSINVTLRVKFDPPALARRPEPTRVTFVEGELGLRELAFESIEKRRSEPWIKELAFEPKDFLQVIGTRLEELGQSDPEFTRRVYRFQLSPRSLGVGVHRGSFVLRTRSDPPAMPSPLPLEVEVLDRVAILPNPVSIAAVAGKWEPGRIVVVRRAGRGIVEAAQWDRDLLDVRRVESHGDHTVVFSVTPKPAHEPPFETTIVFDVGERKTRRVKVRVLPPRASGTPL